jgi:hypothetical protein
MSLVQQNFSLVVGDDTVVHYTFTPSLDQPFDMTQASITWTAYPQVFGVPDKTAAVVTKNNGDGGSIEITDAATYAFTVTVLSTDTIDLAGNYYYEIVIDASLSNVEANVRLTPIVGLMTVMDSSVQPNVIAFKSMFPEFADTDDTLIQIALDQAGQFVDDTWGDSESDAIMYLAAHFIATAQMTSESGGRLITAERIGQISVNYAAAVASKAAGVDPLSSTSYGLIFSNILAGQGFGIMIV